MPTKDEEKSRDLEKRQSKDERGGDGPRQTVRLMADDQPDVGPFFPSGMSAPEAAIAGATEGLTDEQIARIKGEDVTTEESPDA